MTALLQPDGSVSVFGSFLHDRVGFSDLGIRWSTAGKETLGLTCRGRSVVRIVTVESLWVSCAGTTAIGVSPAQLAARPRSNPRSGVGAGSRCRPVRGGWRRTSGVPGRPGCDRPRP